MLDSCACCVIILRNQDPVQKEVQAASAYARQCDGQRLRSLPLAHLSVAELCLSQGQFGERRDKTSMSAVRSPLVTNDFRPMCLPAAVPLSSRHARRAAEPCCNTLSNQCSA